MITETIAVLLLVFYFFGNFFYLFRNRRRLPPGPLPVPLLGNMLQIGQEPPGTQALEKWRNEYGDVYTYWLGNTPFVALTSFDSIKEVLVNNADSCTDREFFNDFYRMIRGEILVDSFV
jgi:cytochrome P450 family 33